MSKYQTPSSLDVSLIMLISNLEPFLNNCLNSILAQNFSGSWEVLIINTDSIGETSQTVLEVLKKQKNIFLINKPHIFYGTALNYGMEKAQGKYITFIEPSDFISPHMLDMLFKSIEEKQTPCVQSSFYSFVEEQGFLKKSKQEDLKIVSQLGSIYTSYSLFPWIRKPFLCTGIYRKSFLETHQIRFTNTSKTYLQEIAFFFQILFFSEEIGYIDIPFYFYRQESPIFLRDSCYCSSLEILSIRELKDLFFQKDSINWKKISPFFSTFAVYYYYDFLSKAFLRERNSLFSLIEEIKKEVSWLCPTSIEYLDSKTKSFLTLLKIGDNNKIQSFLKTHSRQSSFFQKIQFFKREFSFLIVSPLKIISRSLILFLKTFKKHSNL